MTPIASSVFPVHNSPRTWLITSAASPVGMALARAVLSHGDSTLLGVEPPDIEKTYGTQRPRAEDFTRFLKEEIGLKGWKTRCVVVGLDARWEGPFF